MLIEKITNQPNNQLNTIMPQAAHGQSFNRRSHVRGLREYRWKTVIGTKRMATGRERKGQAIGWKGQQKSLGCLSLYRPLSPSHWRPNLVMENTHKYNL